MWFLNTLLHLLLLSTAFVASVPLIGPLRPELLGTASDKTIIRGAPNRLPDGHVPIRREVRDLKANFPDVWSLYILGLRSFQMSDQNASTSYYQIAGIHGMPYKPWEGAGGLPGKAPSGFCPHGNMLFSTWHRPYLALYEQELYEHVNFVALGFKPDLMQRFKAAAEQFRIPYWDWALGDSNGGVPDFFMTPKIQITGYDGQPLTVTNPLFTYEFHPVLESDFEAPWKYRNSTVRYPASDGAREPSHNEQFASAYTLNVRGLHDGISNGFGISSTLNDFSTKYVENQHGVVHGVIGGSFPFEGTMWPVPMSAFEPLFALHHCNVDRLFAMWQAAHPGSYLEQDSVGTDTWWFNAHDTLNANTPLVPFWKNDNSFWTSEDVRDTQTLGYAYPETMNWTFANAQAYGESVNTTIARLYSNSARARLSSDQGNSAGTLGHVVNDHRYTDWNIDIRGSSSSLPSSLVLRFTFIGLFSSDPVMSVGTWNILMAPMPGSNPKKMKRASTLDMNLGGHVSLTSSLLDQITLGHLPDLGAGSVVPFLKQQLTWKAYLGGALIPQSELKDFEITVSSCEVTMPESDDAPLEYSSEVTTYPEITAGKGGGATF